MDVLSLKTIPAVAGGLLALLNVIWGLHQQLTGGRLFAPVDAENEQTQKALQSADTLRGAFVAFSGMVVLILIVFYGIYHPVVQTVLIMCGAALLFLSPTSGLPLLYRMFPEALSGLYFILFALLN